MECFEMHFEVRSRDRLAKETTGAEQMNIMPERLIYDAPTKYIR